jgi:hypothetical protein
MIRGLNKRFGKWQWHKFVSMLALIMLFSMDAFSATVYITPPTNVDKICPDEWTRMDPIMITEGADNADRNAIVKNQTGVTLILSAPSGFYFKDNSGTVYGYGSDIHSVSMDVDSAIITITFSTYNTTTVGDKIKIDGVRIKATTPMTGATGNIMRLASAPGTASIDGIVNGSTVFATLTQNDTMTYSSSTVTQNTLPVEASATDQQILGMEVVMTDACIAKDVTAFALNVTGSSNAANDIDAARIYYTGTSNVFDTTELFGSQASPTTGYTIAGIQTLVEGTNYFWLVYDIASGATTSNLVDAICTNITVDGTGQAPTVTAPSGSRTVGITGMSSNGTGGGDWDDTLSWASNVVPTIGDHVTILSGDTIEMTDDHAAIDITVQSTGVLNINSNELKILGDFNVSGSVNSDSGSELYVDDYGLKPQLEIPAGIATIKKITLDRASGAWSDHNIDLDDNVPADSVVLVLTKGILMLNDSSNGNGNPKGLLLHSFGIQRYITIDDTRHVDGKVSRWINNDGTWYFFPCGDEGRGRFMALMANSMSGNNHNTCRFNWETHFDINNYNAAQLPGAVNDKYYWTHVRVNSQNVARRFYYEPEDFGASIDINDVVIANYTSTWSEATTPTTYDSDEQYISQGSPNASNDTDWTWGSLLAPGFLYVNLGEFTATPTKNRQVQLDWFTWVEFNNAMYIIERSQDGVVWESIGFVKGAGTSFNSNSYVFIDPEPYEGTSYYRFKQVDFDGAFDYSPPRSVTLDPFKISVNMYPNPTHSDTRLTILSEDKSMVDVVIYDMLGRELVKQKEAIGGVSEINVKSNGLEQGVYFISIYDGLTKLYTGKLIKN